jgi:hypothetical protein
MVATNGPVAVQYDTLGARPDPCHKGLIAVLCVVAPIGRSTKDGKP